MQRSTLHTLTFGPLFRPLKLFLYFSLINQTFAANTPYRVVIDPGHGGEDTGGIAHHKDLSPQKYYEKDLTLKLALKTGKYLKESTLSKALGRPIKIYYTRLRDKFVSLEDRSKLARSKKADLFVSIHANTEHTGTARGFETYFLNNTTDKSSQLVAQIENKAIRLNQKRKLSTRDMLMRNIAADSNVKASKMAAKEISLAVAKNLKKGGVPLPNRGLKHSIFYVLLDAQSPAVLFESSFLSNKRDLELSNKEDSQNYIARGLSIGILRYLAKKETLK